MKVESKIKTFVYEDLGFPILLVDCPMKKIFGEWVLDINLADLQVNLLKILSHKTSPLTKEELKFIRKYFEMTSTSFGEMAGVTHAAVLKWEAGQVNPNPATEVYIRLFILEKLSVKEKEFVNLYHNIRPASLLKKRHSKRPTSPLKIQANKLEAI